MPIFRHVDVKAALFAGALSAALLCGSWFFQYVLGYAPCIMCYWQRYAHMAVFAIAAAIFLSRAAFGDGKGLPKWLGPLLLIGMLLVSAGLGAFHVGVELGWWDGPAVCAASNLNDLGVIDPNDPLAVLDAPSGPIACSDVVWSFLGISMAGWNTLLSLLGALGVWHLGFRKNVSA